jgi:hypothetical protein
MSAGVTGAGALLGGVAQYESGQEKSTLFRANAGIAAQQYQSEAQAGAFNAQQIARKGAAMTGQQVANIGANNLQQSGTPAAVVASTAAVNEQDQLQTMNNAMRRAWGFQVQGASDQQQAGFAKSAGDFNAFGTILGGGAKAYDQSVRAGGWFNPVPGGAS